MDFIVQLPRSEGISAILIVVDKFSKVAHFSLLRPGHTTKTVAQVFIQSFVKLHYFPNSIVLNKDPIFLRNSWSHLVKFYGTSLHCSITYHPQNDGQAEVVNWCLEQYLRAFANNNPHHWSQYLHWPEFCYHCSYHSTLQRSPYEVLYWYSINPIIDYELGSSSIANVHSLL